MDSKSYIEKTLGIIEQDFKKITVAEIAKRNNVDKDYLNRLFKRETGFTIKKYIIAYRLGEAKKMLSMGSSVKEACFMSGFKDCSNFSRVFKKYEGYPPSKIKK